MINAWFIVGNANFGKSAIVRALTGVGNARPLPELGFSASLINVDYKDPLQGTHQTFVLASALQEAEILPADFRAAVEKSGVNCVVSTLRYFGRNSASGPMPDAANYLAHFQEHSWTLHWALLGGLNSLGQDNEIPIETEGPQNAPPSPNGVAGQLRAAWPMV